MATVSVRYIVEDVDAAIAFYCEHLGFREVMHPAPTFAMLTNGDLRLVLSAPGGGPGGGQAMPDGSVPTPGGWNRFSLEVTDLDVLVGKLRQAGVHFRNDIVAGVGGKQILVDDPSGNPVELFEPTLPEAALSRIDGETKVVTSDLTSEFLGDSAALVFVENDTYVAQFNWDSAFLVDGPDGKGTGDTVDAAIRAAINQAKERR